MQIRANRPLRTPAIIILVLQVVFLFVLCFKVRNQHSSRGQKESQPNPNLSNIQVYATIGAGLGIASWLKHQATGLYWTLVSQCITIQILIIIQAITQSSSETLFLSYDLFKFVFRGCIPTILGLSVSMTTITPLGLVIFSILGSLGYGILHIIQFYLFHPSQKYFFYNYSFDSSGTISIFLLGSLYGISFTFFQKFIMKKNQNHQQILFGSNSETYMFKDFGLFMMVIFWPVFASQFVASSCLSNLSIMNIILNQFASLVAAKFVAQFLRDRESVTLSHYLMASSIGPISIGNLSDLVPNTSICLVLSFLTTILILGFSRFAIFSKLKDRNQNFSSIWVFIFMPAVVGSLIDCVGLFVIEQNFDTYSDSLEQYKNCLNLKDGVGGNINILQQNFKKSSFSQFWMVLICTCFGILVGLLVSLFSHCIEVQLSEQSIQQQYIDIEIQIEGFHQPGCRIYSSILQVDEVQNQIRETHHIIQE